MSHFLDDLELYAVGALPAERHEEITAHLRSCASCRAAAEELADVVATLAEAVPPREPPAGLRERILAAASEERPRPRPAFRLPRLAGDRRLLVVAASLLLLLGFGAERAVRLEAVRAEARASEAMAAPFAQGGRTWYMAGIDAWRGMGGNLLQPASGGAAVVLFHDLRPLPEGQQYALWLIAPDGKWVRGTSFRPDGRERQLVTVGQELAGFERCAVTVEMAPSGKREGPIVMQSRIAPPSQ